MFRKKRGIGSVLKTVTTVITIVILTWHKAAHRQYVNVASAVTIPLLPISIDIDRYFQKYRDIDIDILSQ